MPLLFSFKDMLIDNAPPPSTPPHESPHRHVKERWVGFIQIPFPNFLTANLGQLCVNKSSGVKYITYNFLLRGER